MQTVNIFLDDVRPAPQDYLAFRTGEELIAYLKENKDSISIETISFDHDLGVTPLGDYDKTLLDGYDVVKYIINNKLLPESIKRIQFHTDNIVGFKNMLAYCSSAQKARELPLLTSIIETKVNCIQGVFSYW